MRSCTLAVRWSKVTSFNFIDPYSLFKGAVFRLDPETAHHMAIFALSKAPAMFSLPYAGQMDSRLKIKVGTQTWSGPIGLAAGLDKDGTCVDFFTRLPFGAVEVGTVTVRPQPGNPRPRLWRYPSEEALRNQMGFNNAGMLAMREQLAQAQRHGKPIGVNLGKNKDTPEDKAHEDYCALYEMLAPHADYMVVNVSSPNTPGLRALQNEAFLDNLFKSLAPLRASVPRDLFLKIAPDMSREHVQALAQVAVAHRLSGMIATNTTADAARGPGGTSGRPLYAKAREVRAWCLEALQGSSLAMIGVGGLSSFEDVWDFWRQGGRAVQIYTSFIYQGPKLLQEVHRRTLATLEREGISNLEQLLANISHIKTPAP